MIWFAQVRLSCGAVSLNCGAIVCSDFRKALDTVLATSMPDELRKRVGREALQQFEHAPDIERVDISGGDTCTVSLSMRKCTVTP